MAEMSVEELNARLDALMWDFIEQGSHPIIITKDGKPVAALIGRMDYLTFEELKAGRDGLSADTEEAIAEAEAKGFGTRQQFIDEVLRQHPDLAPDPKP
jgi:prevent-host-death family protein